MPEWDDTDYAPLAADYASVRRADPRIAAQLLAALGDARTVLNVGAGTGSYEPIDRHVVAVEPSAEMRSRRDPALPPAIAATAEALPFDEDAFDAALAVFTVHHWPDLDAGLAEVRRVTSGPVVIMTADPGALSTLWLAEYAPEFHGTEQNRYPSVPASRAASASIRRSSVPMVPRRPGRSAPSEPLVASPRGPCGSRSTAATVSPTPFTGGRRRC